MVGSANSLNIKAQGVVEFDGVRTFSVPSLTNHQVVVAGSANNLNSVSPSTAGFVLTSNGTSSDPSFQAVSASGAVTTLTGDSGSATPTAGAITLYANNATNAAGATVLFSNSGSTSLLKLSDSNNNLMIGQGAGSVAPGQYNTCVGVDSGFSISGSLYNCFVGYFAGNLSTGNRNTAIGTSSLQVLTSGARNTCLGFQSGQNYTSTESDNILIGYLTAGTTGENNTLRLGSATGTSIGQINTAYIQGVTSNTQAPSGSVDVVTINTSTGQLGVTTSAGSGFIATITGNSGGAEVPSSGNFNILGTGSITVAGSANTETVQLTGLTNHSLLVGAGTATITNLGVATNGQLPIGSTGADPVLAALTQGTGITITNGAGSITVAAAASVATTYTADSGSATPSSNNLNTLGSGSITSTGSGSTITYALTGLTNHNVLIGAGTATITKVAPSATSGVPLISQGSSADPTFGTAVVAGGGTGATSFTAYAPICGGTTTTGALQSADSGISNSGYVLTSTGASSLPTWQAGGSGTGITWNNIAGTTQTAAINNGYVIGNASQTTVTLPTTAALGSIVAIQGKGAGGWILAAGTGQTIQLGASATSTAGSLTSANQWDSVEVVCVTADTTWAVRFTLSAGLTVA